MRIQIKYNRFGFTLVELLVALMVCSIIFGAVASLTYAVGAAYDSTEDISRVQSYVRFTTLQVSELIRHAKIITLKTGAHER